jgi:hypothetical protein
VPLDGSILERRAGVDLALALTGCVSPAEVTADLLG